MNEDERWRAATPRALVALAGVGLAVGGAVLPEAPYWARLVGAGVAGVAMGWAAAPILRISVWAGIAALALALVSALGWSVGAAGADLRVSAGTAIAGILAVWRWRMTSQTDPKHPLPLWLGGFALGLVAAQVTAAGVIHAWSWMLGVEAALALVLALHLVFAERWETRVGAMTLGLCVALLAWTWTWRGDVVAAARLADVLAQAAKTGTVVLEPPAQPKVPSGLYAGPAAAPVVVRYVVGPGAGAAATQQLAALQDVMRAAPQVAIRVFWLGNGGSYADALVRAAGAQVPPAIWMTIVGDLAALPHAPTSGDAWSALSARATPEQVRLVATYAGDHADALRAAQLTDDAATQATGERRLAPLLTITTEGRVVLRATDPTPAPIIINSLKEIP